MSSLTSFRPRYYDDAHGQWQAHPVNIGDTVRDPNPTLLLDWTAGSDNSGIGEYLVGINTDPNADPNVLTSINGGANRHFEFTPTEATTYYTHLITPRYVRQCHRPKLWSVLYRSAHDARPDCAVEL